MKNIKNYFKKWFTLIELLIFTLLIFFITTFIIWLVNKFLREKENYIFFNKQILIYDYLNSKNSTIVCYFNKKEYEWVWSYDEKYLLNKNLSENEENLCDSLKNNFELNPNLGEWKFENFLLIKSTINNLIEYKILYTLNYENNNYKKIYFNAKEINWFLEDTEINDTVDKLINKNLFVTYNDFWVKLKNFKIDLIDDNEIIEPNYFKYNNILFRILLQWNVNNIIQYYSYNN